MPPLTPPEKPQTVMLPPRRATLIAETDVLVVGGGPAGLGAALGATQAGADVLLVERYGFLGGSATAALVTPMMSSYTQSGPTGQGRVRLLMPADHGPGDAVVAGVFRTVVERLAAIGGALAPSAETGYVVPFDPEALQQVAMDLLDEARVRVLLHAFASGVIGEGRVEGVVFETKSGPVVVAAKTVVDCTGDGDVAALAGAPFDVGREGDALVQPMSLMFRMAGFDQREFEGYVADHPDQWRGVHGLWHLAEKAAAAGDLDLPREDLLFFGTPHGGEVAVNSTRVTGVLGIDVWDLTRAEWESRRQMREIAAFLRRYAPGFARSRVNQSGAQVGVRETRRIVGDYQLTADDVLGGRKFPDVIARGAYPIDIHDPTGRGTTLRRLPLGAAYDIPLRCLLPKGVEQLLVAGRCISGTHEAQASYRIIPISLATGQAAGVCAAIAAKTARAPRGVAAEEVQEELRRQGANLGDRDGSSAATTPAPLVWLRS